MDGLGKASRRRQWTALILSGIFPGLGQLYVCAWAKGIAFLGAGTVIAWFLGQLVSLEDLLVGRLTHPLADLFRSWDRPALALAQNVHGVERAVEVPAGLDGIA